MKKIIILAAALIVAIVVIASLPTRTETADFLRIHIRADSNSEQDQTVKYAVKRAVVDYLTPLLAAATDKQSAMQIVSDHIAGIEQVCDGVLAAQGFCYTSSAALTRENFPDRCYGDVALPSGVYDALIVRLGSGSGDNWWCVVYPPLCFVGGEGNGTDSIVYKSRLLEIIRQWRLKHGN